MTTMIPRLIQSILSIGLRRSISQPTWPKVATIAQKVDRRMGACFGGRSVPRPSAPSSEEVIVAAASGERSAKK